MNEQKNTPAPDYTEAQLCALREDARGRLSPSRMAHTLGVEAMAARLARLYAPERESFLRAAALLHDITKEEPDAWQLETLARHGRVLRADEQASRAIWHGFTAALIIPERYPDFADEALIAAVDKHTTGIPHMSLETALLYLADYIEESRPYPALTALRERFFGAHPEGMTRAERLSLLRETLIFKLKGTLELLAERGAGISADTEATLAWLEHDTTPFA